MHNKFYRLSVALILPIAFAACEQSKSSNPLSPLVAGPMAGVSMTAPKALQPVNAATILDKDQPVTLLIQNSQTNSPRTVSMRLQIATDVGFTSLAFSRDGLPPTAASTLTYYRLPDKLQPGRTYYWRVAAGDGANDSGYGTPMRFDILQPVVLGIPDPKSPVGGSRVDTTTPQFTANNGVSTGPHGTLYYNYQVADNSAFSPIFTNAEVEEGTGTSQYTMPPVPAYDRTFFWRVRILSTDNTGDWSRVESFRSPVAPAVPIPAPGAPTGPVGDWQSCASLTADKPALSKCVHDAVAPGGSVARAFEVTKRIAWLLRNEGGGLLIKNGGENIIGWQGYSFSVSRMCFPDGHIYKVISDAGEGGTNGATWDDNGNVDKSLYVPAINPALPSPSAALAPLDLRMPVDLRNWIRPGTRTAAPTRGDDAEPASWTSPALARHED